jgi:hypothetical protein
MPADYSSIRESMEGIERRDVDKWYEGYLRVKITTQASRMRPCETSHRVRNIPVIVR